MRLPRIQCILYIFFARFRPIQMIRKIESTYFKYPPKHQPVVPAAIGFPSRSFASTSTSTCTQLLVMPSMVRSAPTAITFTCVPLPIVTTGLPAVLPIERRRRLSEARQRLPDCSGTAVSQSQEPSAWRGHFILASSYFSVFKNFSNSLFVCSSVRIKVCISVLLSDK